MVNPKTQSVAVTLPSDIVETIEEVINSSRYFSNKPDFVTCAIRDYLKNGSPHKITLTEEGISITGNIKQEIENVDLLKGYLRDKLFSDEYGKKEDIRTIMMKLPEGLVSIMKLSQSFSGFPNLKEFIKYCIVYFIQQFKPTWRYSYSISFDNFNSVEEIDDLLKELDEKILNDLMPNSKSRMFLSDSGFLESSEVSTKAKLNYLKSLLNR